MSETLTRLEQMVDGITFPTVDVNQLVTSMLEIARQEDNLVVFHTERILGFHFGVSGRYFPPENRRYSSVFRAAIARLYVRAKEAGSITGSPYGYSGYIEETGNDRVFILAYNQPPFPQMWLRTTS